MMSRRCRICQHPDRAEIEREVTAPGASIPAIASRYSVAATSLRRHLARHTLAPRAAPPADPAEVADARAALLRDVLRHVAAGSTHAEIAARFSVTTRTVGNWVAEARAARVAAFRQQTANDLLAETEALHADLKAGLLRRMRAAEAAGDDRSWLICARELRDTERDRYLLREKAGVFDVYRLEPPVVEEPGAQQAAMLRTAADEFLALLAAVRPIECDTPSAPDHDTTCPPPHPGGPS